MFGNDNGKKNLADIAPPVGATIKVMPGETWVFMRRRPEGVEMQASEDVGNDTPALLHLIHYALFNLTAAVIQAAKEQSRIVRVPPGTTLRKP